MISLPSRARRVLFGTSGLWRSRLSCRDRSARKFRGSGWSPSNLTSSRTRTSSTTTQPGTSGTTRHSLHPSQGTRNVLLLHTLNSVVQTRTCISVLHPPINSHDKSAPALLHALKRTSPWPPAADPDLHLCLFHTSTSPRPTFVYSVVLSRPKCFRLPSRPAPLRRFCSVGIQ